MAKYVTTAEVSAFTGAPDNSTLASILLGVESLFDILIGAPEVGLLTGTRTEVYPVTNSYDNGRIFYLKSFKPTTITTVNGVSPGTLNTHYTLDGQKLEFADAVTQPTAFPYRYTIVYTSGYANIGAIPADIKLALMQIVGAIWNGRQTQGMSSFRQDILSVNFKDESILDLLGTSEKSHVNMVINRYKVFSVI